jgi:hypothetical protein
VGVVVLVSTAKMEVLAAVRAAQETPVDTARQKEATGAAPECQAVVARAKLAITKAIPMAEVILGLIMAEREAMDHLHQFLVLL